MVFRRMHFLHTLFIEEFRNLPPVASMDGFFISVFGKNSEYGWVSARIDQTGVAIRYPVHSGTSQKQDLIPVAYEKHGPTGFSPFIKIQDPSLTEVYFAPLLQTGSSFAKALL